MDLREIKVFVFSSLLHCKEIEKIERLLMQENGNVKAAIRAGSQKGPEWWERSFHDGLGGHRGRFCDGEISYRAGGAPRGTIKVWRDGMECCNDPDYEFTWYEVYEWIKSISDRVPHQLQLQL